jgi:hypothetical protein
MTSIDDASTAGWPVEKVITQVKEAIAKANVGAGNEDLVVTSIAVELKVLKSIVGGAAWEWKVPIIGLTLKGGSKVTQADTETVTLKLVPPESKDLSTSMLEADEIGDDVVRAVSLIRAGIVSARTNEPIFGLGEATFELEFGVTAEGELSLIAVAEGKREATNKLTLTLGPRSALKTKSAEIW